MPKQPKIRITKQDKLKIKKLNRSVSNKKSRIKSKFGIQMQIKTRPIKSFQTRKEFNEYVKLAETFIDRKNYRYVKNEHGIVFTREEVTAAEKMVRKLNKEKRARMEKIDKIKFKTRGKSTDMRVRDRRLMGDLRYGDLDPVKFNINRFRNRQEFQNYTRGLTTNRDEMLKENYIKSLETVFGREAQLLVDAIENMEIEDFILMWYTEDIIDIQAFNYNKAMARTDKYNKLANLLIGDTPTDYTPDYLEG